MSAVLTAQNRTFDVAVIGAGVFGAWTAYRLARSGRSVLLADAYGAANSRASSSGESRILRMGYGPDEIYTRKAQRSLALWQEFFGETGSSLFHRTGVLWLAREGERYAAETLSTLARVGIAFEKLSRAELTKRFPQMAFADEDWGIFEPESGALLARSAVLAVVNAFEKAGGCYAVEAARPPKGPGRVESLYCQSGAQLRAGMYVFACGPWLPRIFPELLGDRIFPSRQEVFFFGVPPGNLDFSAARMPGWIDLGGEMYGIPDLENRGCKAANDRHGRAIDPDTAHRAASETLSAVRDYLRRRFPALRDAPVVETRVCQYENTWNGDFLIDRHPEFENVWVAGGGSGHGFKHGPAIGEYIAGLVAGTEKPEPRFRLSTKQMTQKRAIY